MGELLWNVDLIIVKGEIITRFSATYSSVNQSIWIQADLVNLKARMKQMKLQTKFVPSRQVNTVYELGKV